MVYLEAYPIGRRIAVGDLRGRPRGLTITKMKRDPEEGFYRARVHLGGDHAEVDNRFGSWHATRKGGAREFVLPPVAAALQSALPRAERKRR